MHRTLPPWRCIRGNTPRTEEPDEGDGLLEVEVTGIHPVQKPLSQGGQRVQQARIGSSGREACVQKDLDAVAECGEFCINALRIGMQIVEPAVQDNLAHNNNVMDAVAAIAVSLDTDADRTRGERCSWCSQKLRTATRRQ